MSEAMSVKADTFKNTVIAVLVAGMFCFGMGVKYERGEMHRLSTLQSSLVPAANAGTIAPAAPAAQVAPPK